MEIGERVAEAIRFSIEGSGLVAGAGGGYDQWFLTVLEKLMGHSVRSHLNVDIGEYDETIRRWIPGYEEMLRQAATAAAACSPQLAVDLGAGTGALSEALLEHEEVQRVRLLDIDPEMLQVAKSRLDAWGPRAEFTLQSFDDELPKADVFVASLSLHHIPTIEEKRELFARVHEALPAGGRLINADCCMPVSEPERRELFQHWVDHQVTNDVPEEQAWRHFDEWSEEDTYLPLDEELAALESVGFDAERIWNDGPIGVVVATRK